jgi:hypothetical protein
MRCGDECGGHGTIALFRLASAAHITHTRTDKMTDTRKANAGVIFENVYGSRTLSTAWPVGAFHARCTAATNAAYILYTGRFNRRWSVNALRAGSLTKDTPRAYQRDVFRHRPRRSKWRGDTTTTGNCSYCTAYRRSSRCGENVAAAVTA